jgi:nitrous oxide reductase accessory protein NosL
MKKYLLYTLLCIVVLASCNQSKKEKDEQVANIEKKANIEYDMTHMKVDPDFNHASARG